MEIYPEGTVITIHEAPVRNGYAFKYWKGSEYDPGDKYTVTEDHVFTAQWEKTGEPDPNPPDTGDEGRFGLWHVLLAVSLIGLAAAAFLLKKYRMQRE